MNLETIKPLPFKEIAMPSWWSETEERLEYWNQRKRILFFDPKQVYGNIGERLDIYKRNQQGLNSGILFPQRSDGLCRCGCGQPAKKFWHSKLCSGFAYHVYYIIAYGTAEAKKYLTTYYGNKCLSCNERTWDEVDHIIPVKHGGGGCWLSNYSPLCKVCHKDKTKKDFQWGQYKPIVPSPQLNLILN